MDKSLNELVDRDLLFDFYGDLLTDHQKRIFEEVVFNDYSVSEVARDEGISRQSVYDMIQRCTAALVSFEEKLGLAKRFREQREAVREIRRAAERCRATGEPGELDEILRLCDRLLESF